MNENLNLVEILKDCPKGTKLYSPALGEVELRYVEDNTNYPIAVRINEISTDRFTADGKLFGELDGECLLFPSKDQRDWSKFKPEQHKKPKFDPKNLQPFDKVLARDALEEWRCTFFSHIRKNDNYPYVCIAYTYEYCIPYNDDTKHLVGTTKDAPEFYRFWGD